MAEYISNKDHNKWTIVNPNRQRKPNQYASTKRIVCPFCPGNEKMTPTELFRIGAKKPDTTDWRVRVVSNLYPITDVHEIIIHSQSHKDDFEDLTNEQNIDIITAFKERYCANKKFGQVIIFVNHGRRSGGSLMHPHSQLIVVPNRVKLDCLKPEPVSNLILENRHFVCFCPNFSQWPYEVWIKLKRKNTFFGDIRTDEIVDLAIILKMVLKKLRDKFSETETRKFYFIKDFSYNLYISPYRNWYIRIIPKLMNPAGFEFGTGLNINIIKPSQVATELKKVKDE